MVAYESGLRTGEIPLLPLHVAEHCKGARQGPGVYGATMLFPSMGIGVLLLIIAAHWQKMLSTFVRSGCLRFTRCQGLLLPRPGACSFPLRVARVWYGTRGSSTAQWAQQRECSLSAPAPSLCGWLRAPFPGTNPLDPFSGAARVREKGTRCLAGCRSDDPQENIWCSQ